MLLIDIGNTRIKWAQQHADQPEKMHAIVHINQNIDNSLISAWQDLNKPDKIYLACVGPQNIKQQIVHFAERLWSAVNVQEIYTRKYAHGVCNAYPKYNKLGVDRWLALLAAYHYYNAPVCIVSCGSALTLDIVDRQGQHLGGMIMPGLNLMQQALSRGAANLNYCTKQYPLGLANNTEAAIYNGNLSAIQGFIERGLSEYKKPLQLILTGGDAGFVAANLKLEATIDAQLVLKGLALVANE